MIISMKYNVQGKNQYGADQGAQCRVTCTKEPFFSNARCSTHFFAPVQQCVPAMVYYVVVSYRAQVLLQVVNILRLTCVSSLPCTLVT